MERMGFRFFGSILGSESTCCDVTTTILKLSIVVQLAVLVNPQWRDQKKKV